MLAVFPSHPHLKRRNISVAVDHPRERAPSVQEGGQRRGNCERWSEKTWMKSNGLGKETGPGCWVWWTVAWSVNERKTGGAQKGQDWTVARVGEYVKVVPKAYL